MLTKRKQSACFKQNHIYSCHCRRLLQICAESQMDLAKEKALYEMFVDEQVVTPFHALVEVRFS